MRDYWTPVIGSKGIDTMWTLGIETSCRDGSVALLDDDQLVTQRSLSQEGRRHARTLVHELKLLLADAGIAPHDCDVVAVSRGPGSFTGLRVGVVCAKTWAYATGCRLAGVDSLQAVAEGVAKDILEVDVIADAQRGDIYLGRYVRDEAGFFARQGELRIIAIEDWLNEVTQASVVAGPAVEKLQERLAGKVRMLSAESWHPTAVEVARIGRRQAGREETVDVWALEPTYLRRSAAEEKAAN